MRVLLTGGTGFIGSRVLPLLKEHEVLCLSREPAKLPRRHGMEAITADLGRDGDWINETVRFQPEWCLHLAWEGLPDYSLERCRTNLDAGLRLIGAVARSGVRRMVVAGTCAEYGRASGAVSEESVPIDRGFCAATKHAQLNVLEAVARDAAFSYQWARIFFVYGPGQMQGSLIPSLRASYTTGQKASIRTPDAFRDFVYVEDVASALVSLVSSDVPSGVFNVGSGQPTSVGHVANLAAEYYDMPRPIKHPPVECPPGGDGFWADTHRLCAATGWRARIGIKEGVAKTLKALDGK